MLLLLLDIVRLDLNLFEEFGSGYLFTFNILSELLIFFFAILDLLLQFG